MSIFKPEFRKLAAATLPFRWKIAVILQTITTLCVCSIVMALPQFAKRLAPIRTKSVKGEGRNVLFVSYYSPPYKSNFGTQRVAKFAKYLVRLGWNVTFFSTQPRRDSDVDPKGELLDTEINVFRVPAIVDHPLMRSGVLPPDDFVTWTGPAIKGIKEILETRPISVIVATAPPYTNMLAAAVCSVRSGVPLVTDFRDPWTKIDVVWILKNRLAQRVSQFLERQVLNVSSRVVMTDEKMYLTDYFVKGSNSVDRKVVSITNGYDEADFENIFGNDVESESKNKFSISYVGGFYSEQNCHAILDVLKLWAGICPEDMREVVLEYAGGESRYVKSYENLPVEFRDHGYVSHRESILLRNRCDIQLFAQPSNFKAHVFSGKIFEMIRIPKPILALTREDGAVARLLAETNTGIALDPKGLEEAALLLKQWFDAWKRSGRVDYAGDLDVIARYSRESLAKQLSEVLDEVRREV